MKDLNSFSSKCMRIDLKILRGRRSPVFTFVQIVFANPICAVKFLAFLSIVRSHSTFKELRQLPRSGYLCCCFRRSNLGCQGRSREQPHLKEFRRQSAFPATITCWFLSPPVSSPLFSSILDS